VWIKTEEGKMTLKFWISLLLAVVAVNGEFNGYSRVV
jgi:hypothetical protein